MFCFNRIKAEGDCILAICDEGILGETFKEDGILLDVKESFYCKEKVKEGVLKGFFEEASIINAVGEEIVDMLIDEGLVNKDKVLRVEDIPHAQVVKVE